MAAVLREGAGSDMGQWSASRMPPRCLNWPAFWPPDPFVTIRDGLQSPMFLREF
jgi:hypothetical protein